jgi:O-antigen ligase
MSVTPATWAALAVFLVVMSFKRPAYAVAFYMMTFFAAPHMWWWGDQLPDLRYSLISGLVVLASVVFYLANSPPERGHRFGFVHIVAIGMALNATFVHFALASVPSISIDNYIEMLKLLLLVFLVWRAIENRSDMRIVMVAIALGAAYIGYEVTINERGDFNGARLEGVGAPGAESANSLASVMLLTLPLIGTLFVEGRWWHKLTAMLGGPMALNVLLLCNSRGAFLGLIGAAGSFLLVSRGKTRVYALRSLALGGITLFMLLGDPEILERFMTTFVGSEERDESANSRLQFWQAGFMMIADYPLGDGGGSFKYVRGGEYLRQVIGESAIERSLHNGYLTEATEWGIQGLFLRLLFVGGAMLAAYRTSNRCRIEGRFSDSLMGICLISAGGGYLIHCMFGSFISNEWGYWIVAILIRYGELYQVPETVTVGAPASTPEPVMRPRWGIPLNAAPRS